MNYLCTNLACITGYLLLIRESERLLCKTEAI
jgi:hypothetical protein